MTTTPDAPGPKTAVQDGWAELLEIGRTVAYALAIALVLRIFLFQPFTIPSASMEPALLTGDYVIVSKYSYGYSRCSIPFCPPLFKGRILGPAPKRGDIVVFQLPRDLNITYVKRLIGLPGDRIQVRGGVVYVNGKMIPRTPLGPTEDPDTPGLQVMQYAEPKPDGHSYITFDRSPDHEGDDTDVYVVPQGHYFMMGDNRDNSLDSRWPQEIGVGFVPAENFVGRAELVLVSWHPGASLFLPWTWFTKLNVHRLFHPLH
jgi:signal peptidase I